jgi:PAS domain S-box-containing protein
MTEGLSVPRGIGTGDERGSDTQRASAAEHAQTEGDLRAMAARFEAVLQTSPIVLFCADRELRYTWLPNPALGHTQPQIIGKRDSDLFPPADAKRLEEIKRGVLESGKGQRHEVSVDHRGVRRYFDLIVQPQRDATGAVVGLMGASVDVTDRKGMEEKVFASEARFRKIFETAPIGIVITDREGRFLQCNPAYCAMLGYAEEDLRATVFGDPVHPDDLEANLEAIRRVVRGSAPVVEIENRYVRSSGELVWVHKVVSLLPDETGAPGHVMVLVTDVTERRRAEEALRASERALLESDRRKSEFLAVLSHEIRTPLAAIVSAGHLLDGGADGGQRDARARGVIRRQADHLTKLVDDLLDLSRIHHGKITLARSRFDARQVIRRACEDIQGAYDKRGVALALDLAKEPLWLDADATRIAQIAANLLTNALKFTPRAGSVVVRLRAHGGACELSVRDTGAGIEPDVLDRIFEPFEQSERTRQASHGGLGIGLALVKLLVLLHDGAVRAESEGEGRGAALTVSLPLAAPPEVEEAPRSAVVVSGLAVLIIEDNADAAETLAELLTLQGHSVRISASGRQGIAALERWTPDVILCDVGLPDITGYQVVESVRQVAEGRPPFSVALTGYALPEDVQRARAAGFDAHLPKPPSLEQLRNLLNEAAATRGWPITPPAEGKTRGVAS